MLLISCVLAVTSVLTGYVCEVFLESICNVFNFCDFLFTIPDDTWSSSCYIPWSHFMQMRPQLPWIYMGFFDGMLVEGRFCCLDHIDHLVSPHFIIIPPPLRLVPVSLLHGNNDVLC